MITINERIKKLRKSLDFTQQEFAEKIGTARNNIAGYETGKRSPSEAVISLICKTFNVNEGWLRTGDGEMFLPKADTALELLAAEHNLTGGDRILIERFLSLKPEDRRTLVDYVREAAAAIADQEAAAPAFAPAHTPTIEGQARTEAAKTAKPGDRPLTIDEQVELYRQQLLSEEEQAKQASSAKESGAV